VQEILLPEPGKVEVKRELFLRKGLKGTVVTSYATDKQLQSPFLIVMF
jgi:hypothetical protein